MRHTLIVVFIVSMVFTLVGDPLASAQRRRCYRGSWIDSEGGHHFVAFEGLPANVSNWKVTSKPRAVRQAERLTGKVTAPWGPTDQFGRLKVGFPWPDNVPWEYSMSPQSFRVCGG
ncbi:MAG TPA: hypothetical protein PKD55_19635 [Bellilinea sp.]|nr:hypothetical protein [Bellilinea sp.]